MAGVERRTPPTAPASAGGEPALSGRGAPRGWAGDSPGGGGAKGPTKPSGEGGARIATSSGEPAGRGPSGPPHGQATRNEQQKRGRHRQVRAGGPEPARPAAEIGRRAPGRQVAPQAPEGGELVTACAARRLMLVEAPRDRGRRLPVEQVHHLFAKSMAIHHVSPGPDCALRPIMKSGPAPGP